MKRLLIALFFLLIPQISLAFDFNITDRTLNVPTGSSLTIDAEIHTLIADEFNINIVYIKPWVSLSTTRLFVNASETDSFSVSFSPYLDTTIGLYKVQVVVESIKTGEMKSKEIYINVAKEGIIEIDKIFVTGDLEPAGLVNLSFYCKNLMTSTAQNAVVSGSVNSPSKKVYSFYETIGKLDPDATARVDILFYLEDYAEPGRYVVNAVVEYDGKSGKTEKGFVVAEKPVIRTETDDFIVLGTGRVISVSNVGNKAADMIIINETITGLDQLFFSGNPTRITGNTYIWEISSLQAGEEQDIRYAIDYLPLLVLIIIVLGVVWYLIFRFRTVVIKKTILQKKAIKEGSEFTVGIEIKNNTGNDLDNVVIRDFVPSAFAVHDAHGPKPTKKETAMGAELRWKVDKFTKGENRIFNYRIVPVFGIYGEVKLSGASVRFKKKNISFEAASGSASLGVLKRKEDEPLKVRGK